MTLAYHEPAMADLDDVDRALIDALVADGRASYAALARRIGMSQAAIKARVLRLLDSGGIHILGRIDPRALGYGEFAYCLIDVEGPVEPAADRLAEMDEAAFVLILAGARGLFVEFRARDAQQLDTAIERARSEPGVRGVDALSLVAYVKQDWSQSGQDPAVTDHRLGARRRPVDATDIKLLESLAANGRATFAEMADAAGMSQAATRCAGCQGLRRPDDRGGRSGRARRHESRGDDRHHPGGQSAGTLRRDCGGELPRRGPPGRVARPRPLD